MAVEHRKLTFALLCVIAREQFTEDLGEWSDRIKTRLVRLKLPYPDPPQQLTAAMEAVARTLANQRPPAAPVRRSPAEGDTRPLTHAESVAIMARLGIRGVKTIPAARPMTMREADHWRALRIVAQGITEQRRRCAEAERIAAEANAAKEDEPCR